MGDSLELGDSNAVNGVALNTEVQQCLSNGLIDDGMSAMASGDVLVVKKLEDSDEIADADAGEYDMRASPSLTASPLINNDNYERKDDLNMEVDNCDNSDATSNISCDVGCDPSHSVNDELQTCIVADIDCEVRDTSEHHCLDQASDSDGIVPASNHCVEILNSAVDESSQKPASCATSDTENANTGLENMQTEDLQVAKLNDNNHTDVSCDSIEIQNAAADGGNTENQCTVPGDSRGISDTEDASPGLENTEAEGLPSAVKFDDVVQNSAADGGNVENQCTMPDESHSSHVPPSPAVSDTGSANSGLDSMKAEALPATKCDETHHTDAVVQSQLQLECEGDEVKSVSGNAESEKLSDGLACSAAVADSDKNSPSHSTSQVSAADVATSSEMSLSSVATVVISPPSISSLNTPGLPAKVAVLCAASSSSVARPAKQCSKPLAISAPPATVRSSNSSTRLVSKVLQDIGLLLVSQKVFKNLATIQKQKISSSQRKCDTDLLQKLKTSHQNLASKNQGLLTVDCKCSCGFHSESMNVIEAHRLRCDFQGCCCYCQGNFVYHTQKKMQQHLWKVHKKVGKLIDRTGSLPCSFCPVDFSSRLSLMRHMGGCRQKFSLTSNLAPRQCDKDIPVTGALKQQLQVPVPVMVSSSQISPVTVAQTVSCITPVSSAAVMPPVNKSPAVSMQLAPPARNPGPVAQVLQIGKQLFTFLPSANVAGSMIAVNQPPAMKAIDTVQPARITNPALPLPVVVNNRSTEQAAGQASKVPASVLPCSQQYSVCPVCSAFVKDKSALLVHMGIAHGTTHKMCQFCCSPDVTFPNLVELQLHIANVHTSDCWICRARFQPPGRLITHIADRHKVTMYKMLELRRCYLCSEVPSLTSYAAFEEHMMKLHAQQFSNVGKLWDYIVHSPNANKNWYAKVNPDSTLECPHCLGQFISKSFLYRHLHLEHDGNVVKWVHCSECKQRLRSNDLLVHRVAAHTRRCSVQLYRVDVPGHGCIFVPPVGTKRIKNRKGEPLPSGRPLKRVRTAETVVISDDDDIDYDNVESDSEGYVDDSSDEDFVSHSRITVQPKQRLRRFIQTRVNRRNSSVDDVHEVLESIVDSSESDTAAKRSVSFTNTSIPPAPVDTSAASQLCNGITEDEVEIIESIVQRPVNKPEHVNGSDRNHLTADAKTTSSQAEDARSTSDNSKSEMAEHQNGDCLQVSAKSKSASSESSARQLMERKQIMVNSVEEVLEVDGETVLIVHDDDNDDDDDDDDDN